VNRRTTRRVGAAAVLAAALALSGCGATDALVGLHPAPAEETSAAPLDDEGATAVAARLLSAVRAAAQLEGDEGAKARAEVMSGDALTFADATAERGGGTASTTELAKEPEPTVVAQSQGRGWPRAILATTLDETTNTRFLHVMVSEEPQAPFSVVEAVPMLAGAELPAIGAEGMGAPFVPVTDDEALVMAPDKAFAAYADAIAYPKPKSSDDIATDDAFAQALKTSAEAQTKALKKLGTLTQKHEPQLDDAVAFRLADGGVVAFGLMQRTDTIKVAKGAKELVLPSEYEKLVGKKKVTKSVTLTSLESVILVVPTDGKVRAIGAAELLVAGKGS
jgi:hypothetical protein